jgi:uncharacterized protein YgiM (DUF1202 family)
LVKGETMKLVHRVNNNWFDVQKEDGTHGLVPANYLEEYVLKPVLFRATAAYSGAPGKLALAYGEEMTLVKKKTADWFEVVKATGEAGLVPSNYIEEFDPHAAPEKIHRAKASLAAEGGRFALASGEVVTVLKRLTPEWVEIRKASGEKGPAPSSYLEEYTALFTALADFAASNPSQLSFEKGQVLTLSKHLTAAWIEVRNRDGKKGVVPSSFVEMLNDIRPSSMMIPLPETLPSGDLEAPPVTAPLPPLPSTEERSAVPVEQWSELHVLAWVLE